MNKPTLPQKSLQAVLMTEKKPLNQRERNILKRISNQRLWFIGTTYAGLTGLLILAWIWAGLKAERRGGEEKLERYLYVAPIVVGILFLILTIYFIRYYLQTVHHYRQDLKNGVKELVYFIPEPYKTPFFETYYIRTISEQRPLIRVSPELYQLVQPGSEAIMGIAPRSHFVFYISVGDEILEFDHRSASLDS